MRAELVVTPTDWGTKLEWSCHYPPEPGEQPAHATTRRRSRSCTSWCWSAGTAARTVAGTWTWSGGTSTGLDASSAVPLTDMDRIEITLDGHEEALAAATL